MPLILWMFYLIRDEPYENHNIEIFHGIAAVAISFLLKNQYGLS